MTERDLPERLNGVGLELEDPGETPSVAGPIAPDTPIGTPSDSTENLEMGPVEKSLKEKNSQKIALQQGLTCYLSETPRCRGHVGERYTQTGRCAVCARENGERARRLRGVPKRPPFITQETRLALKEAARVARQSGPFKTPEEKLAKNRAYGRAHRERMREKRARARVAHRLATPEWLSKEQKRTILEVYKKAVGITIKTGMPWEVDHIIPLRGKTVCGLHVPWNLQIITKTANGQKRNHLYTRLKP